VGTSHLSKLVESNRRRPGTSSFIPGPRPERPRAPMVSAPGGRSRQQNLFYAIADGGPIWASTTVSNGPALSSSDEGDAGSCLLLGGLAGKTSATNRATAPLAGSNLG
jgi:hypothetical protein